MANVVKINEYEFPIREYNGQRVVTFKDIDAVHGRAAGTARKRFNDNREHFIEGVDFFKTTCSEVRPFFGQTPPNGFNPNADITLMTESGYLMLVKSFTDELAWDVQRALVNGYFRAKESGFIIDDPSKVASLINSLRGIMKDQRSSPTKIAVMAEGVCRQFGVNLPSDFVEVSPWEQLSLTE